MCFTKACNGQNYLKGNHHEKLLETINACVSTVKTNRTDAGTDTELQASSLLSGYKAKQLWKTAWLFHT